MDLFDNPFDNISAKQLKKDRIRQNRRKGRAAEDQVRIELQFEGYEVERTGRGSDFRAKRRDIFTGEVVEEKLVEVKSGNAKLSDLQKQTKKGKTEYEVRRRDPLLF